MKRLFQILLWWAQLFRKLEKAWSQLAKTSSSPMPKALAICRFSLVFFSISYKWLSVPNETTSIVYSILKICFIKLEDLQWCADLTGSVGGHIGKKILAFLILSISIWKNFKFYLTHGGVGARATRPQRFPENFLKNQSLVLWNRALISVADTSYIGSYTRVATGNQGSCEVLLLAFWVVAVLVCAVLAVLRRPDDKDYQADYRNQVDKIRFAWFADIVESAPWYC